MKAELLVVMACCEMMHCMRVAAILPRFVGGCRQLVG
jgi:hypothetical protein